MGLSRRQFTKEFKIEPIRRLEQGVAMGEVSRALEVNANVRAFVSHAAKGALAMRLQFPAPAVQLAGIDFQRASHFGHALSTVQPANCRLFEFFGEFSTRLHRSSFPIQ